QGVFDVLLSAVLHGASPSPLSASLLLLACQGLRNFFFYARVLFKSSREIRRFAIGLIFGSNLAKLLHQCLLDNRLEDIVLRV
ncbi:hypothetical protein, partial [Bartonella sp. CL32QHWL-2]|uniref:hypothetical protein n=1 Tax=Bartonella sp. CL32QHWL-2 TaxID=3243525 RepID=UPI0035CF8975